MNGTDYSEEPGSGFAGRGLIIVFAIIISSASFVLGFFVGKYYNPGKPETMKEIRSISQSQENQAMQPAQHEATIKNSIQNTAQPQEIKQPEVKQAEEQKPSASPETKKDRARDEKDHKKVTEAASITKQPHKSEATTQVEGKEGANSNIKPASSGKIVYTVQIGAFKSEAEAENIRAKYDKKGYKAYIIISHEKNKKIYKVRTGEFREKKDADILSLKLRKTEGLNTFVTFRNE